MGAKSAHRLGQRADETGGPSRSELKWCDLWEAAVEAALANALEEAEVRAGAAVAMA